MVDEVLIIRMADPSPFGETSFRAIVRAICDADPANVRGGGCVESVLTLLTQRRCGRFLAMARTLFVEHLDRRVVRFSIREQYSRVVHEHVEASVLGSGGVDALLGTLFGRHIGRKRNRVATCIENGRHHVRDRIIRQIH
jgi:hypothetical protein